MKQQPLHECLPVSFIQDDNLMPSRRKGDLGLSERLDLVANNINTSGANMSKEAESKYSHAPFI
jgi:hypothetical protein